MQSASHSQRAFVRAFCLSGAVFLLLACLLLPCRAWSAKPSLDKIIQDLQGKNPQRQRVAARRLSKLPASKLPSTLLPLLEGLIQNTKVLEATRNYLCDVIGHMGTRALSVIPVLQIVATQNHGYLVRMAAINAISKMGPKAVPVLAMMAQSRQDIVRVWSAGALARMGPLARTAVPALMPMLQEKHWQMRWSAVLALSRIGVYPKALRQRLLPMLESRHKLIRVHVCRIFGRMGWAGAFPGLLKAGRAKDWLQREESLKALLALVLSLGPKVPKAALENVRQQTRTSLVDPHPRVRAAAIVTWVGLHPGAPTAFAALQAMAKDPARGVRRAWLQALLPLGLGDKAAEQYLLAAFRDKSWAVRKQAARELGKRKQLSGPTIVAMAEQFRRDNGFVKQGLMLAFQQMGPKAVGVAPVLIEQFRRSNRLLHQWVRRTLVKLGVGAIPALVVALGGSDWHISQASAKTLVAMRGVAVPALVKSLAVPSYKRRQWAAYALGKIGAPAQSALPALRRSMQDKHPLVRNFARYAIQQLQRVRPPSRRNMP